MSSLSRPVQRILRAIAPLVFLSALLCGTLAPAQPHLPTPPRISATPIATDRDMSATQEQLIKLLRLSPTLTTVVEHDPTLLSNQDYVRRNNPQLAQFLDSHPEIALNPDFYLFTRLPDSDGHPDQALERAVWPELNQPPQERPFLRWFIEEAGPFLIFACILGALLWLIRQFLENRRWSRIFKLQMDVHGKLIDKFASSAELHTYMETEAGRRFLEAAPLPVNFDSSPDNMRVPNAVARVLTPLQIGIVLSLLGTGFLLLRHVHADMEIPMLVLGTVFLMPGLGFIISAGVTWLLAGRLGLMPQPGAVENKIDLRDRL